MDSELLKSAIADAKAVRQTALANAKVALEEQFSAKYEAMFAQKLKEDAGMINSPNAPQGTSPVAEENVSEQEIDELIKELEQEVGDEPHPEPEGDEDPSAASAPPVDAGAGTPAVGGDLGAPAGEPPVAPPGYLLVPIASLDQTTQAALGGPEGAGAAPMGGPEAGGPPAVPGADAGAGAPPSLDGADSPPPSDVQGGEDAEDINLDELLESLKEEIAEEGCDEEKEEKLDEEKKLTSSAIGGKVGGSDNKKPAAGASASSHLESGGAKKDGYPSGDAKQTAKDPTEASRPNEGKNATSTNQSTPSLGGSSGPALKASRPNQAKNATATNLSTPGGALNEENAALKKQLNEAEDTIKYVKGQLNEINLLNAKLLYTNKLFKEYNMNNTQKMRIVEMFDLSKSVREVKLTYTNLAETLNFGGGDIKRKVVSATNANAQSITEGLASKPVGSTKPSKELISEGKTNKMVADFQRLAGIKPTKK